MVILRQGISIFGGAWREMTDASASAGTIRNLSRALDSLSLRYSTLDPHISFQARDLRARRAGSLLFVDLVAYVPGTLSVEETTRLETDIADALKAVRKEVAEVNIKFRPLAPHS